MEKQSNWPVVDQEGYCQSYQRRGRWQNDWRKNKPNIFKMLYKLKVTKNENGALEDLEIDKNLPVITPYWLSQKEGDTPKHASSMKGSGIRATWIGHATVLAEIDGFCILCDPIIGTYCGPELIPTRFKFQVVNITFLPVIKLRSIGLYSRF